MKRILILVALLLCVLSCIPVKEVHTVTIEKTFVPAVPQPIPGGYNERVWLRVVTHIYGHLRAGEIEFADEYFAASVEYNGIEFARATRNAAEEMVRSRIITTEPR